MTNITLLLYSLINLHTFAGNYGRQAISFVRGRGAYLYTADGTEYLDALTGIAVWIGSCSSCDCGKRLLNRPQP